MLCISGLLIGTVGSCLFETFTFVPHHVFFFFHNLLHGALKLYGLNAQATSLGGQDKWVEHLLSKQNIQARKVLK